MPQLFFPRKLAVLILLAGMASPAFAQNSGGKSVTITRKASFTVQESDHTVLPDGRVVYRRADQMPQYGGDLQAFMAANLRYPEPAQKDKTEGKSIVRFIVNEQGKITDASIIRSSGSEQLDAEALRVVSLMTDWRPGVKDGYPVPVYMTLPVQYRLD